MPANNPPALYDPSTFRTFEIIYSDPNWHDTLIQNFNTDRSNRTNTYVKADLMVDGVTFEDVGVQYKGNSSFHLAHTLKKPIKITMDAFIPGQELLGHDILTFNNGIFDPTLVREILCYDILRKYMPAPRANAVQIKAGLPGSIRHIGVYVSVERIDKKFLKTHFDDGTGNRYKAIASSMTWAGDSPQDYGDKFTFSGAHAETAYLDLIQVLDVLNRTPITRLRERLDTLFSVDRAVRQIAAGNALLNWDDLSAFAPHGHNYYLYWDQRYKQMSILPWDWDLGFSNPALHPIENLFDESQLPLIHRLMKVPELKARYFAFVKMMIADLDWSTMAQKVQGLRELTEDAILSGEHEFFSRLEYEDSFEQLEGLVAARREFLEMSPLLSSVAPKLDQVSQTPMAPMGDESVTVTALVTHPQGLGAVNLYYQVDRSYQTLAMFDDGAHGDGAAGDGIYGAVIPFQRPGTKVNYYLEAFADEEAGGAVWFAPIFTEQQPYTYKVLKTPEVGDVVINEVLAHSDDGLPDWIELYNTTESPISVGEWFVSDDEENFKKYQINAGTVIPAGGYLVLYEHDHFGEQSVDPGRLEPFALSENGETVYLSSGDGSDITGFKFQESFGASATGMALGRYFKPSTQTYNFVPLAAPTPGFPNSLPLVGPVVIREIMYAPTEADAEYLELVNISDQVVRLYDDDLNEPWQITDGIRYSFPSNPPLRINPGESLLLVKDQAVFASVFEAPEGVRVLQWDSGSLSNGGEKVELGRPGDVNQAMERQFIRMDRVNYDDANGWPVEADGGGKALRRRKDTAYGNDVANWIAEDPTPGLAPSTREPVKLVYPWLSNRAGSFESILVANNLGSEEAQITLTATRADGSTQTIERTLAPQGFLEKSVANLFTGLGSGAGYTVVLESDQPQVYGVWVTHSLKAASGQSPSQGVAVRIPQVSSAHDRRLGQEMGFGYLPLNQGFLSAPVLVNTGEVATDIELDFYNRSGLKVGSQEIIQLEPGKPFAALANDLVSLDDPDVMLLAKSSGEAITGVSFVFNSVFFETAIGNGTQLTPIQTPDVSKTLLYPWISNRDGQFQSTLVLNNPGPRSLEVELMAMREAGDPVFTQRTIPAGGFLAEPASSLFPGLGSGNGFSVVATASGSHIFGQWVSENLVAASGASPSQGVAVDLPLQNPAASDRVGKALLFGYAPLTDDAFSAPVIVNLHSEPTDVTLYFFNGDGELILKDETSFRNLQPMRPYARLANDLLPAGTGNVQVIAVADAGRITGVNFVFNATFAEPAIGNGIALDQAFEVTP